jgi:hypothetical protein
MEYSDKGLQNVKKQESLVQEAIDSVIKQQNDFQMANLMGDLLGAVTLILQISYTVGSVLIALYPVNTVKIYVYQKALDKAPDVADYLRQKVPGLKGSSGLKPFPLNFVEQKGASLEIKHIMKEFGMKAKHTEIVDLIMGSLENLYKTFQVGNMIKSSIDDQVRLTDMYSYQINQLKQRLAALKDQETKRKRSGILWNLDRLTLALK